MKDGNNKVTHNAAEPDGGSSINLGSKYSEGALMQCLRDRFDSVPLDQLSAALIRFVSENEISPSVARIYKESREIENQSEQDRAETVAAAKARRVASSEAAIAGLERLGNVEELVAQIPPAVKRSLDEKDVDSVTFGRQMNLLLTKKIVTKEQAEAYVDWRAERD